jgi:GNAT superfamily N-acetyltransferase
MRIIRKYIPSSNDLYISKQIQAVYEESFPIKERAPFDELLFPLAQGKKRGYIVEANSIVLGFAFVQPFGVEGICFLEYIAIKKEARNQNIGGDLLDFVINDSCGQKNKSSLLFEVESPSSAHGLEKQMRMHRIQFYQQHGAELVDDKGVYLMPDYSGKSFGLPMRLMWISSQASSQFPYIDNLKLLFIDIYRYIYNRSEEDPLLQSIIHNL